MNNERTHPGPLTVAVLKFCRLQFRLRVRGAPLARSRRVFVPTCGQLGRHLPQLLPVAVGTVQPDPSNQSD